MVSLSYRYLFAWPNLSILFTAEPLTEEEQAEKQSLQNTGFGDWHKRDFQAFIRGCERYGREDLNGIAAECAKSVEDVKRYSDVFWERYKEIEGRDGSHTDP